MSKKQIYRPVNEAVDGLPLNWPPAAASAVVETPTPTFSLSSMAALQRMHFFHLLEHSSQATRHPQGLKTTSAGFSSQLPQSASPSSERILSRSSWTTLGAGTVVAVRARSSAVFPAASTSIGSTLADVWPTLSAYFPASCSRTNLGGGFHFQADAKYLGDCVDAASHLDVRVDSQLVS